MTPPVGPFLRSLPVPCPWRLDRTEDRPGYGPLLCVLLVCMVFVGCETSEREASNAEWPQTDTLSVHEDGTPKQVAVRREDSILERRHYRRTGTIEKIVTDDSVQTYFDLHDVDSATVLKDYLLGHWRNLAADPSRPQASAFYVFDHDQLTFESPNRTALETLGIEYDDNRTLRTEDGMSVQATVASFDTVHITGYTLVRISPADSL